ncbi:unnamed protein product [Acanthoscelides obtectus]|uniref:Uncharacterized protein n=1 Tax=Acanthoscelides obtectus TaxID=200917 RepID=A0A9P0PAC5_ACAOB|nr:unnamed protein product [Acanthoscelides obtectus]CAK1665158.1 hypothetical protein AOBTE_LOCUS24689 [Acanthoscelides obtectus]
MKEVALIIVISVYRIYAVKVEEREVGEASDSVGYKYPIPVYSPDLSKYNGILHPSDPAGKNTNLIASALVLSSILGLQPPSKNGYNHPELPPLNPYIQLLLSHYGRYLGHTQGKHEGFGSARGLYGYTAVNNIHNNKPFGAYKIYEDAD